MIWCLLRSTHCVKVNVQSADGLEDPRFSMNRGAHHPLLLNHKQSNRVIVKRSGKGKCNGTRAVPVHKGIFTSFERYTSHPVNSIILRRQASTRWHAFAHSFAYSDEIYDDFVRFLQTTLTFLRRVFVVIILIVTEQCKEAEAREVSTKNSNLQRVFFSFLLNCAIT